MNMTLPGWARKKSKFPERTLRPISKIPLQKKPISIRWISIEVPSSRSISFRPQPATELVWR